MKECYHFAIKRNPFQFWLALIFVVLSSACSSNRVEMTPAPVLSPLATDTPILLDPTSTPLSGAQNNETYTQTSQGLAGEYVGVLVVAPLPPLTIYAGTGNGLFKSADGGEHWLSLKLSAPITALAIDPQNPDILYVGTDGDGIYKSVDGGQTWAAMNTGLTNNKVYALAIDPQMPATLYAGTYMGPDDPESGVYKSTDGGENWGKTGETLTRIYSLVIDPDNTSILYAGAESGLAKSTDGGAHWVNTSLFFDSDTIVWDLAIDPRIAGVLYAGTSTAGVFKSVDGGLTWEPKNTKLTNSYVGALLLDSASQDTLYAGNWWGNSDLYKTTNGGETWQTLSIAPLIGVTVNALAMNPAISSAIYVGTTDGVIVVQP
jgi:ligand-binding sensor domain-containing protein